MMFGHKKQQTAEQACIVGFNFDFEGENVRIAVDDDGVTWWVAKDVCRALGVAYSRDATARLPDDERGWVLVDTPGGRQLFSAVNEPGLYRLIFTSRTERAEDFRKWVLREVLPSIRKTGRYELPGGQRAIPADPPPADVPMDGDLPLNCELWLSVIREKRRTFSKEAAREVWRNSPLPACAVPFPGAGNHRGLEGQIIEFLHDWCDLTGSSSDFVRSSELRDSFKEWCHMNGIAEHGPRVISNAIKRVSKTLVDGDGKTIMQPVKRSNVGYTGVQILTEAERTMADAAVLSEGV